jgi:hypothetical protein
LKLSGKFAGLWKGDVLVLWKKHEKRPLHHHTICNLEFPEGAYAWFVSLSLFSLHPHCSKSAPLPSSWLQTSRLCMAASSPNGSLVKAWGFGRTMRSSLEQGDARDLRAACVQISDAAIELIAISNANRRF